MWGDNNWYNHVSWPWQWLSPILGVGWPYIWHGSILSMLWSIEVTLSSDPPEEDAEGDVGLQVKVSFMDKAVMRNARLAGKWGPSENTLSYFPFAAGEPFKVHTSNCAQALETLLKICLKGLGFAEHKYLLVKKANLKTINISQHSFFIC